MDKKIGSKIKELREKQHLTQKQLSQMIGCTEVMISRYELGVSNVSIGQLEKLSGALGVTISHFFDDSPSIANAIGDPRVFKTAFVFDLDDTLIDGRQFCGETIARVITSIDESVSFDLVVKMHESIRGMTIEDLYVYILDKLNLKADISELLLKDRKIQEDNIDKMKIFDGVVEILEFLKNSNKRLFICTNRSKPLMKSILKANHIDKYFEEVISCVDAGYKKPNPYCLIDLINRSKINPKHLMYFGDSEIDSQFAKNANIDHIIFDQYLNDKTVFKKLVNMFLEKQLNGS